MRKIYYLQKHLVEIGDIVDFSGFRAMITEELISLNPELFLVKDTMKELLDKAKKDYPAGTMFNSKYGVQKVLSGEPFVGIVIPGTIQINTDRFTGGATIYTPEDGWAEVLPIKFVTEDGIRIYGDMKTYAVAKGELDVDYPEIYGGNSSCFKYFYHKENALAYIKKHKEKTLGDYEQMLFKKDGSMTFSPKSAYFSVYGWLKDNEPKLYYTKLLQLIADDLNGDWEPNFNNERQKKYFIDTLGVKVHCSVNYGLVYFKSMCLAQKARNILGDRVKYLFNN